MAAVRAFQARHVSEAPAALARLQDVARAARKRLRRAAREVKVTSLGQISHAAYAVGGEYGNM